MTVPSEIAAKAAITITIGTSGELPPSLEAAGSALSIGRPDPTELLKFSPWLPC